MKKESLKSITIIGIFIATFGVFSCGENKNEVSSSVNDATEVSVDNAADLAEELESTDDESIGGGNAMSDEKGGVGSGGGSTVTDEETGVGGGGGATMTDNPGGSGGGS